jgi:hypothetical protein
MHVCPTCGNLTLYKVELRTPILTLEEKGQIHLFWYPQMGAEVELIHPF